jgi:hypothetical protein
LLRDFHSHEEYCSQNSEQKTEGDWMAKGIRVSQLANELDVKSRAILAKLRDKGLAQRAPNQMSVLPLGLAETVRSWFRPEHSPRSSRPVIKASSQPTEKPPAPCAPTYVSTPPPPENQNWRSEPMAHFTMRQFKIAVTESHEMLFRAIEKHCGKKRIPGRKSNVDFLKWAIATQPELTPFEGALMELCGIRNGASKDGEIPTRQQAWKCVCVFGHVVQLYPNLRLS